MCYVRSCAKACQISIKVIGDGMIQKQPSPFTWYWSFELQILCSPLTATALQAPVQHGPAPAWCNRGQGQCLCAPQTPAAALLLGMLNWCIRDTLQCHPKSVTAHWLQKEAALLLSKVSSSHLSQEMPSQTSKSQRTLCMTVTTDYLHDCNSICNLPYDLPKHQPDTRAFHRGVTLWASMGWSLRSISAGEITSSITWRWSHLAG